MVDVQTFPVHFLHDWYSKINPLPIAKTQAKPTKSVFRRCIHISYVSTHMLPRDPQQRVSLITVSHTSYGSIIFRGGTGWVLFTVFQKYYEFSKVLYVLYYI
jgi:hypothetical protein